MSNIHQYWRGIAQQREALPPGDEFFLISMESKDHSRHKAGVVCAVLRELAAKCLNERTHRLATEEEIVAYKADLQRRTDELAAEEVKKKQQFALPAELNTLVMAMLANAQPKATPTPEEKKGR